MYQTVRKSIGLKRNISTSLQLLIQLCAQHSVILDQELLKLKWILKLFLDFYKGYIKIKKNNIQIHRCHLWFHHWLLSSKNSKHQRMAEVGKDLWRSPSLTPLIQARSTTAGFPGSCPARSLETEKKYPKNMCRPTSTTGRKAADWCRWYTCKTTSRIYRVGCSNKFNFTYFNYIQSFISLPLKYPVSMAPFYCAAVWYLHNFPAWQS